MKQPSN